MAKRHTRRRFLQNGTTLGAGMALSPLVLKLTACGTDDGPASGSGAPLLAADEVLLGAHRGSVGDSVRMAAERLDFSWLGKGDSVAIKVATNAGEPHPAITSPKAVATMVKILEDKGAGRVVVCDQAGVESVRRTAMGRYSATREHWERNGMIAVEDVAEVHFFDDEDYDDGYFEATLPKGHRWPRGMMLANIVKEVDHIINMPRIGNHVLCGLTLAQKMSIGWLRDDSRHDLHNDAEDIYEKYAEVNYTEELQSRVRFTLTAAPKILLYGGPDRGTVFESDPPLVIASQHLANHDALASSILVALGIVADETPSGMIYREENASGVNRIFANGGGVGGYDVAGPWMSGSPDSNYEPHAFEKGVTKDRATMRGWELSGGTPEAIRIVTFGETLDPDLQDGIETHGEGLYDFA